MKTLKALLKYFLPTLGGKRRRLLKQRTVKRKEEYKMMKFKRPTPAIKIKMQTKARMRTRTKAKFPMNRVTL